MDVCPALLALDSAAPGQGEKSKRPLLSEWSCQAERSPFRRPDRRATGWEEEEEEEDLLREGKLTCIHVEGQR